MTSNNSHVQHPPECDSLSALLENPGRVSTVPAHMVPLFIAEEVAHSLGVTKRWGQRRAPPSISRNSAKSAFIDISG